MIAAYVDGVPLPADEVYRRLESARQGPAAALLPHESTAEGRQLVRWLTQVVVTDRVLTDEAARRGLPPAVSPWRLDPTSRVQLGGALAAALAGSPAATAAAQDITADAVPAPAPSAAVGEEVARAARWVSSVGACGADNGGRPWLLEVESLPTGLAAAVAAGEVGAVVSDSTTEYRLGDWSRPQPAQTSSYDALDAARNLALLRWVDERIAAVVRLEHGFEHPGDIDQPDHTHRH